MDAAEDAAHGPDVRGDELPAELQRREERLAKIAAAKARLEARQAEEDRQKGRTPDDGRKGRGHKPFARDFGVPPDDAQDNFTDPESRIMKTSTGFDQCYNGQLAVDETSQIIVATGLTNCGADNAELLPLIDHARGDAGRAIRPKCWPMRAIAARRRFRRWKRVGITAYISLGHETRPAKPPNPAHAATQRMADRLKTAAGRARYRRRKAIVEPVLGWIKEVLGFRRFSLRGVAKARGEWNARVPRRQPETLTPHQPGLRHHRTRDVEPGGSLPPHAVTVSPAVFGAANSGLSRGRRFCRAHS